jgi:hypothetical protein
MDFFAWARLLARHSFAVHPSQWHVVGVVSVVSLFHTLLRHVQHFVHGDAIARTPIREAPVFIIGHWRTGTTFLHELLIEDERHTYPNTYECLEPNHFLLTERIVKRWFGWMMPSHRPMDNMKFGWDRPQEDEFALCMMGQPSPYLSIAFPNRPPAYREALDLEGLAPRARAAWKRAFHGYLQRLTYKDPRRLILKSPPHSCRIKVLLELFPEARFVHIVRDPFVVFPSTLKLWKTLYRTHGLQRPNYAGLEEQVYTTFLRLYKSIEEGRQLVPPGQFYELRYEELVRDPTSQLRVLYKHLDLGGFDVVQPRVQRYLADVRGYETNRYQLTAEERAAIVRRWEWVFDRYGYPKNME